MWGREGPLMNGRMRAFVHAFIMCVTISLSFFAKNEISKNKHLQHAKKEMVTFRALEDGSSKKKIIRRGVLVRRKDSPAVMLICHGFMCDKDDIGFLRHFWPDYDVMTFDFRAHGELINGQCCSFGYNEKYDVKGAVDFIRSHPALKNKPILVYGFSMGAVSAIEAQAHYGDLFKGMILDCPFDTTDNIIQRSIEQMTFSFFGYEFGLPGRSILQRYAYHPYVQSIIKFALKAIAKMDATQINTCMRKVTPVESIKRVTIPVFIISCLKDKKVPEDAVRAVYQAASSDLKCLWLTDGKDHFGSYFKDPEKYIYKVRKFAQKVLNGPPYKGQGHKIVKDSLMPCKDTIGFELGVDL